MLRLWRENNPFLLASTSKVVTLGMSLNGRLNPSFSLTSWTLVPDDEEETGCVHVCVWTCEHLGQQKEKKNQLSKIDCYLNINLQFFYNRHWREQSPNLHLCTILFLLVCFLLFLCLSIGGFILVASFFSRAACGPLWRLIGVDSFLH